MSDDRDDRTEDKLRRALSAEAGQVSPGGDGLMNIQQRVAARDARMRWLRPALAGSVALVVVAVGAGGYAIARHGNNGNAQVKFAHSTTPAPHDVAANDFPADAIFPFTNVSDEQVWEKSFAEGNSPWISDPTAVVQSWLKHYLDVAGNLTMTVPRTGSTVDDIEVNRIVRTTTQAVAMTVVHVVKYHNAWLVTGASDPAGDLVINSPTSGSAVSSPLTVSGPGYGVDEQAKVEIRDATTPKLFGSATTGPFGNGTAQWSATVPFTASSSAGVVVATVSSGIDGGVGTLAAEKVTFGAAPASWEAAGTFYGVHDGQVLSYSSATGAPGNAVMSGNTVAEAKVVGNYLYDTSGPAGCPLSITATSYSGGVPSTVANADPGYGITGFDVSPAGRIVYFESGCGDQAGKGKLVFPAFGHGPGSRAISFPSLPPVIEGDPVWESDGIHVDAFVRTGNLGYLARYDSGSGDNAQPNTDACPGFNIDAGLPNAVAEGPDGNLWVASQTGTSMQVVSCTGTKPTTEFTVSGNDSPQSLSINSAGEALLVGTTGKVWKWTPGTNSPRALSEASGVTSVAW